MIEENWKDRIQNYEAMPPEGSWDFIAGQLDREVKHEARIVPLVAPVVKTNHYYRYLVAASLILIMIIPIFLVNRNNSNTANDTSKVQADKTTPNTTSNTTAVSSGISSTGTSNNTTTTKQVIINNDKEALAANKHFIVIKGKNGEPVKVSSKLAGYISFINQLNEQPQDGSASTTTEDDSDWLQQFREWKGNLQTSVIAPTTSNFLDIAEFTSFLKDNS